MSQQNPFASPVSSTSHNGHSGNKPPLPSLVVVVLIFTLILGVMGFGWSSLTGLALVFQSQTNQWTFSNTDDEKQQEMLAKIEEIQRRNFRPGLIITVCNMIIAPMLVIGSIGGFARRRWALNLLLTGYLAAIFYKIGSFAVTAWLQLSTKDLTMEMMQQSSPDPAAAEFTANFMQAAMIVGLVIGGIIALALIIFYLLSFFYFRRPNINAIFS